MTRTMPHGETARRAPARRTAGLQLALGAALLSGLAVFVNGRAVARFPSATVYTTGKNLVAGLILLVVAGAVVRQRRAPASPASTSSTQDRLGLGAVAVIGGAVPFVLFFEGLARATSSDAAFIHKTMVVWVALLAVAVLRERITAVHVAAVVGLIVAQIAIADGVGSLRPGLGEAMILAATLCWSVELIVVKRLVESIDPTVVGAVRIAGGAVLLMVWLSVTGKLSVITSLSGSQWAWLALTGTILSVFVSVWFAAIARAQVVDAAAILVVGAVVTGLLDLVAGGAVVPVRAVGWVLMVVATGALGVRLVLDQRPRALA